MKKKIIFNPIISIIINCHNASNYLLKSINSVLKQSYSNWELIFWDNQSCDQSAQIVKRFRHPKIKYFLSPNFTPLGEARYLALSKSQGQWIAFLDCDDYWDRDKDILILDKEIFDAENNLWVREVEWPLESKPSPQEAHILFLNQVETEFESKTGKVDLICFRK